jgi:anti-sigma regulatory factor (Ser/Thr protein kinase)
MEQLATMFTDPDHISCEISFDADHSRSKIIRDFVGNLFDIHHIEQPWKGRFVLITDELINNAIEHGSQPTDIDSCVIEAHNTTTGFTISLEVHDTGRGKDAKDATHMETIRDNRLNDGEIENGVYMSKRGRGLFYITEKLVDRLSFAESPRG